MNRRRPSARLVNGNSKKKKPHSSLGNADNMDEIFRGVCGDPLPAVCRRQYATDE